MRRRPALALLALWALAPALAWAAGEPQETKQELERLEHRAEESRARAEALDRKAGALQAEVRAVRGQMIAAARESQKLEAELTRIEATLTALEEEASAKRRALAGQRERLGRTLAALQRIAVLPPEALLAVPGEPVDVVRSATLLAVAVPGIEARAERLEGDLAELDELGREIAARRAELDATADRLAAERTRLAELIERKRALHEETAAASTAAAARADRLAGEAADLRELLDKLARRASEQAEAAARQAAEDAGGGDGSAAAARPSRSRVALAKPGDIRAFPERRGSLRMPAEGRLVGRYGARGEAGAGGRAAKGITIATRARARVVAPYDGQVAYAGPFRGYGPILIIEHGGGYHSLLAGLERIDAVVGQWVLAGEPVGVMGDAGEGHPELYVELRRGGDPINPLPWLAATGDKVRG